MSFYLNNNNPRRPSTLGGGCNGPCEKILIEAVRVFDACLLRDENVNYVLTLEDFTPADPTTPLTFVSATNNGEVTVNSSTIDSTDCRGNFARVTVSLSIPVTVTYTDAAGVTGTATGTVSVTKCAILNVPQGGLNPVEIRANANFLSAIGSFTGDTTVSLTACLQTVIKVVGEVDILLPSYGYPNIPCCNECSPTSCNALFRESIYPTL